MLNVVFQISVLIIIYNLHRLTYKYHRLVQNNSDKPGELPAVERCVVDEDEEDEEEVMLFMAILLVPGQNWSTSLNLPLVLCRIFHEAHFRFICACPIVCLFFVLFYFFSSILRMISSDERVLVKVALIINGLMVGWKSLKIEVTGPNKGYLHRLFC